jgi:flagellar protein FliS
MTDTMNQTAYQKAVKTYQKNSDENLTPLQIVVELYKGMLRHTKEAKKFWEAGRLDMMTNSLTRVFDIIEGLQMNLDFEKGGEDAVFLNRFYNVVFSALSQATAKPDPAAEYDAIIAYIQQVHDRWYAMAYAKPPENPA